MNLKAQADHTYQGTGTGNEEVAQWRNTAQYLLKLALAQENVKVADIKIETCSL